MPLLLTLLVLAAPTGPESLRGELTLSCAGCFSLEVELDGARLVSVGGLGAARLQQGKLSVDRSPRFEGLTPGSHHLRVVRHDSPLSRHVAFDGPFYIRPGAQLFFDVEPERLVERAPTAGPAKTPPPPGPASLTVRAEDDALCDLALDGTVVLHLQRERVARAPALVPGVHRLEVRGLQGQVLAAGTLFVGVGEEATGGVHCRSGAFVSFADPLAYHADPPR